MSDDLTLLLTLKADASQATSEVKRFTDLLGRELVAETRKTSTAVEALQKQRSTALIAEDRRTQAAMIAETRKTSTAVEALQKQRSAAIIAQFKAEERAAQQAARAQIKAAEEAAQAANQPSRFAGALNSFVGNVGAQAVSALTGAVVAGAHAWLDYASKVENSRIAFTTMLGSVEAADTHLRELADFARTTPFEFGELVDASQKMQALGFKASQVVPILTDVGNAVAAAGGGGERLERVVLALSQIQSKGKVATQELNQLAEAGIPAFKILEQQYGKTGAEIRKLVETGQIGAQVFLDAFQRFSQANFGGLMEQQSRTFTGALSNINDALLQTAETAFNPLFQKISEMATRVGDAIQGQDGIIATLNAATAEFGRTGTNWALQLVSDFNHSLDGQTGSLQRTARRVRAAVEASLYGQIGALGAGIIEGTADFITGGRDADDLAKQFAKQNSNLSQFNVPLQTPDAPDLTKRKRKRKRGADKRQQEALKSLEDEAKAAEDTYKREVEADKRKYELMLDSLADFTAKEIAAEEARYQAKQSVYLRERALVKDGSREANEIDQKLREADETRTANILKLNDTKNKKIEDAARAHEEALLKLEDDAGNIRSLHIKAQLDANVLNHEQAEDALFAQAQAAITRRRAFLQGDDIGAGEGGELKRAGANSEARQKILDELALLNKQEEQGIEQHNQRLKVARGEDAQDRFNYLRTIKRIQQDITASGLEAQQAEINALARHFTSRSLLIEAQRNLDLATEDAHHEQIVQSIHDEEDRAVAEAKTYRERFALHQLFNQQIEQEDARHRAANATTNEGADKAQQDAGPFGAGVLDHADLTAGATAAQAAIAGLKGAMSELRTVGKGLFKDFASGIGQMVSNWVLLGSAGPNALRKMTAQLLASLAAQAAVESVMELARGFAALANPFLAYTAPAHFTAAAIFATVAGVSALAGRAIAGNLFQQGGTGGSGASGGTGGATHEDTRAARPADRTVEIGARPPQVIQLHIVSNDSHIVKTVMSDFHNAGVLRDHVIQIVGGDA